MPYIGNTIRAADDYRLIDDISSSFNGSTTSFALQVAGSAPVPFPKSPQQVLISVNGVIQEPDPTGSSGFNLVGTNIVFSSAPTNGHAFFGIIYATADYLNAGGNFPSGSLGAPSFTFIGDENTGLYRKSGGSVGFVSDATEIANFDSNGITISSGNLIIPDSIIHNGDSNTKIRFPGTDIVTVETGGSERLRVDSAGLKIEDKLLHAGDIDTAIRFPAADTISFETNGGERARITSGGRLGIGDTAPDTALHVKSADNILATFESTDADALIEFKDNGTSDTMIIGCGGGDNLLLRTDAGNIIFNLGNNSEKARFDSSGRLLIGTTTEGHSSADDLTISGSGQQGITIRCGTNNDGAIFFADGTSGNAEYRGFVQYNQPNDKLNFGTSGLSRITIDSSGHLLPNADSTHNIGADATRFANGYFDTLYGDGSNLTGLSGVSVANQADNRLITATGTTDALNGEANLTFDGSTLLVTDAKLRISSATPTIDLMDSSANPDYSISNNNGVFRIRDLTNLTNPFLISSSELTAGNHLAPSADNSFDLGLSNFRWRNVFTTDLHLSNKGSQNDVDSTWGDYTIQEGFEDLYLLNNRTGKRFKFNLTEVS